MLKTLTVPSLIITDLDIQKEEGEDKDKQIESLRERCTTNNTLIHFLKGQSDISSLAKCIIENNIYIAYQGEAEGYYATSFEEALILVNYNNEILNTALKKTRRNTYNKMVGPSVDYKKIATGIDNLMNIDLQQLEAWYKYISSKKKEGEKIVYHTYHSTKGLEFENVIIVMEKGFGRMRSHLFESYFKNYDTDLGDVDAKEYEYARNLFYVATTRAIKNLKIFYVDDVNAIQNSLNKIFS